MINRMLGRVLVLAEREVLGSANPAAEVPIVFKKMRRVSRELSFVVGCVVSI